MLINKLMSNQFATYFQILIQNICLSSLIVCHDLGFPRGLVNGLVCAMTPGRRMSNFHPCQHLGNLAFWSRVPLSVSPLGFCSHLPYSRISLKLGGQKRSGRWILSALSLLSSATLKLRGMNSEYLSSDLPACFFFPLSLPSFFFFFWGYNMHLWTLDPVCFGVPKVSVVSVTLSFP